MSDAELEVKSLQDLQTIITEAKKWKIKLAVIDGYTVQESEHSVLMHGTKLR